MPQVVDSQATRTEPPMSSPTDEPILVDPNPSLLRPISAPLAEYEEEDNSSSSSSDISSVVDSEDSLSDSIFGSPSRNRVDDISTPGRPTVHPVILELLQNCIRDVLRNAAAMDSSPCLSGLVSSLDPGATTETVIQYVTTVLLQELPTFIRSVLEEVVNKQEFRDLLARSRSGPLGPAAAPGFIAQTQLLTPSAYIVCIWPYYEYEDMKTILLINPWNIDHNLLSDPNYYRKLEDETVQSWQNLFGPLNALIQESDHNTTNEDDSRGESSTFSSAIQQEATVRPSDDSHHSKSKPSRFTFYFGLCFLLLSLLMVAFTVYRPIFPFAEKEAPNINVPHYYWAKYIKAAQDDQFFLASFSFLFGPRFL